MAATSLLLITSKTGH